MKPKPKKTKKKLILLHLPNKISRKETRMTILLLSIVFCHICLTMPSNLSYFLWTVFPDFWADYDGRVLFEAVSDVLCCINYSLNFYLYCVACKEIRDGVKDLWNSCWVCCCLCNCGGTI